MSTPLLRRQTTRSVASISSDQKSFQTKPLKPVTLARRLLFPQLPPDADLPPLLLSESVPPELNAELYDFIAIGLRAYVHPWWSKITRYDKEFLPVITRVLTSVIRTVETRIGHTDLSPILLRDIPVLLTQHIADYRNARSKLDSSYAVGGAAALPHLFHQMQPHMALSPDGRVDEIYIRQAVDEILRTCLPSEDYEPDTERYIVREIVVKVLLDSVIPRITQPWFVHQSILNLLGPEKNKQSSPVTDNVSPGTTERPTLLRRTSHTFSLQSLAILFFSTVQTISGACLALLHAYRHALETLKRVNQSKPLFSPKIEQVPPPARSVGGSPGTSTPSTPSAAIIDHAPPSPPRRRPKLSQQNSTISSIPTVNIPVPESTPSIPPLPADYLYPILQLLNTLLSCPPRATATALLHVLSILLLPFSTLISRVLPYILYTHTFSGDILVTLVRSAKAALFPGGWPAAPPPDPTPEEQTELRKEVTRRLLASLPRPMVLLLGSDATTRNQAMEEILEPLSSQECNAHLIIFILDLVLISLFPEMGVGATGRAENSPQGSFQSTHSLMGDLTPPRPDSRPP